MEYTLDDAFETLKDTLEEQQRELENLMTALSNNEPITFDKFNELNVGKKQQKLCDNLTKQILQEEIKNYTLPDTSHLQVEALTELEEEVKIAQELLNKTRMQHADIKNDISYLEKKKIGFETMKQASLGLTELEMNCTYEKEYAMTKRIFRDIKLDLHRVVEELFPENHDIKKILADLTMAYTKGGDESYVKVKPEDLMFINFLIEAGIVIYHGHDRSKVRLINLS